MGRGYKRIMTDYASCDSTSLDRLYLLITESLPYLFEMKQEEHEVNRQVTFSINGFDTPPNNAMFRNPWWQEDD
jgi:hypothetical protein